MILEWSDFISITAPPGNLYLNCITLWMFYDFIDEIYLTILTYMKYIYRHVARKKIYIYVRKYFYELY